MSSLRPLSWLVLTAFLLFLVACGEDTLLSAIGGEDGSAAGQLNGPVSDEFVPGRTGNWVLEQDELGSTAVVNEQLVITVVAPNTIQYSTLADRTFTDFVLEVDAWQRSGPPQSSYGVLFRMQEDGQLYRFDITGNGLYMVERRGADGTWTRFVPEWTPTAAINQGLNVANRLKIIAAGSEMAFYANDILLTQISDTALGEGQIGLAAGSFAGETLQVSFDNLSITPD